jgi:hypothetical protein
VGEPTEGADLDAEDAKLVTLARSARARAGALEAVAVRDAIGRTYSAVAVALPSLTLSACQSVAAAVVSSGADEVEAAVVVGDRDRVDDGDLAVLSDLGPRALVLLVRPDGSVVTRSRLA